MLSSSLSSSPLSSSSLSGLAAAGLVAGIDIGQRFLDLAFAPVGRGGRFPNTAEGIARLVRRLIEAGAGRVVIEAIGSYAVPLVEALAAAGRTVVQVNPRRIKAFREAEGKRAKTDRLDAALIARFGSLMPDALDPVPNAASRALRALSVRRRQLTEAMAMEKTRLKQALEPLVIASLRRVIADLGEAVAAIELEIDRRLAADPELDQRRRLVETIPGIGKRISSVLLTELPELGRRDRKAIASLVGLAPQVSQSGNAPPRAAIAGGRPCVRAALYMSALVAVRHDPHSKAAYEAMRAQGKPAKVALVAVARRILVTANAILKANRPYEPTRTA